MVLGWLAGLGLLVVPWVAAGILATLGALVGPESWEPERTFPWLLLVTLVVGLSGIALGSVRNKCFRRGALPATAIAVLVIAAVVLALALV